MLWVFSPSLWLEFPFLNIFWGAELLILMIATSSIPFPSLDSWFVWPVQEVFVWPTLWKVKVKVLVAQLCQTVCNPMDCSCQAALSMGFPRQEYWSGCLRRHESLTLTFLHTTRCFKHMVSVSSVTQLCPTLCDPMNQHVRSPCPSPTPGVYSNSCPSSRWCHPAISSSVTPFSSCPQSLRASGSFPMSQLLAWGDQSIGVSTSASVLPMNTQDWSPLGWAGWISLQSEGLSRVFSNTIVQKHQFFGAQLSSQFNSHVHTWPLKKP